MNFEYNGNLEEKERIIQVAKEIIEYYPEITFENAKIIASLEDPITTEANTVVYFKRLYNILFGVQQDKNLCAKIYNDITNIYKLYMISEEKDEIVDLIMEELIKYFNGSRLSFPIISEFY